MTDEVGKCIEILTKAIAFEEEGIRFFSEKAETAISDLEKRIFRSLAKDEQGHRAVLVGLVEELRRAHNLTALDHLPAHEHPQAKQVFEVSLEEVQDPTVYVPEDLEILQGAMEVERRGYAIYTAAAAEVQSPKAKALFEHLAREEQIHYQLLSNTHDFLEDPEGFKGFTEGAMLDGG